MTDKLLETIIPKSDQLNADDLLGGPQVFTIKSIKVLDKSEKQSVWLDIGLEGRPYKPCLSMRRVLIASWEAGELGSHWVGRSMQLFCEETVKFGSDQVGGIRISHLTDIPKEGVDCLLTVTRGKRKLYHVDLLEMKSASTPEHPAAESVTQVKELWKSMRKRAGDPISAELWKAFVFETTARAFDPGKPAEWTVAEYRSVFDAIDELTKPAKEETEDAN